MKYSLGLLILLVPFWSMGQVATSPGAEAMRRLDDLKEWWSLGVDSTSESVDIRTFNRFKICLGQMLR
jgi:hypothetical protein